ncbi:MAG TPA: S53 family peptidase [Polyangiaceae bacterium]|nr:S53 family peptidase [Polyangiaceae bacterium]
MDKLLRLRIVLRETNIGEFYDYAYSVSDPQGTGYGQYMKQDARSLAQVDLESRYKKVAALFREAEVVPVRDSAIGSPYSPLLFVDGSLDYFSRFIERKSLVRFLADSSGGSQLNPWEWEQPLTELEHEIRSIHVACCGSPEPESTRNPRSMRGLAAPVRGVFVSDPSSGPKSSDFRLSTQMPRLEDGMTPKMIREHYNFPNDYDCAGQTIAIMSIGASTLREALLSDLSKFWQADARAQPEIDFVPVGPQSSDVATSPLNRLEASMGPAWIGALAPGAKIVVYEVASNLPDPWLAVVEMAVSDPRAPNILCMTWTQSEDMYYRQFNRGSIALALAKAAAFGITVIAASGDWGVYDGRPAAVLESDPSGKVARAAWPHATFPSSEEFVLSVGGTLVSSLNPPTEIGWSGPLPPDPALAKELPFLSLASSGGFSERVPVPEWQRAVVVGLDKQRSYSRGTNLPAVLPYGRGYPDVALMASGPALSVGEDDTVSAMGYRLFVDGNWIGYAGGTSMAAPIWAAIIALANARRHQQGLAPLGFLNPLLYYIARTLPGGKQAALRDVSSGNSDIQFRVVSAQGRADQHTLAGYCAKPQWDPITGLGVPNVLKLTEALLNYPANFREKTA